MVLADATELTAYVRFSQVQEGPLLILAPKLSVCFENTPINKKKSIVKSKHKRQSWESKKETILYISFTILGPQFQMEALQLNEKINHVPGPFYWLQQLAVSLQESALIIHVLEFVHPSQTLLQTLLC